MTISFVQFLEDVLHNPVLLITVFLTLGVILVNGWTDAPNAIATCISTRSMSPKAAIVMAAVFNFLGVFVMTLINSTVAETIYKMVDFGGESRDALVALCAALFAIVVWATAAWRFGIPTSESHALIAGVSGAAIALQGGLKGINGQEWVKVLYGLGFSTLGGFAFGWIFTRVTELCCRGMNRRKANRFFKNAQVTGAAAMAFMHGAQDGQKFIGVFLLSAYISNNRAKGGEFHIPIWLMLFTALVISLGTATGGYRIIKSVSMDMVKLKAYQGFSADLAGSVSLLLSSFAGLPVSTTQAKTSAIMGVGASRGLRFVNWRIAGNMVATWLLTFPGCAFISYFVTKLFFVLIGKS